LRPGTTQDGQGRLTRRGTGILSPDARTVPARRQRHPPAWNVPGRKKKPPDARIVLLHSPA